MGIGSQWRADSYCTNRDPNVRLVPESVGLDLWPQPSPPCLDLRTACPRENWSVKQVSFRRCYLAPVKPNVRDTEAALETQVQKAGPSLATRADSTTERPGTAPGLQQAEQRALAPSVSPVKATPFFLRKETDNTIFLLCCKRLRGTRWLSVKGVHINQSGSSVQRIHARSLLHGAQLYAGWFYRHYPQHPCCSPFCWCTAFSSLLATAFPKISLFF